MNNNQSIAATKYLISREGYHFDPSSRIWKISRVHSMNIAWVDELLENDVANSFLKTLAYYTEKYSSAHANNQCMRFFHFAKERFQIKRQRLSTISAESLISYRSTLDHEHEWYLGVLRSFLNTWIELDFSGIDKDIISLLDTWRLKGNIKGRAVQTLCPKEGPLSDLEFEALHQALTHAFEINAIEIECFILVQLFMATGRRPAQLADLKIKDFVDIKIQTDGQEFFLNVPRRKLRGVNWREQFKTFALSKEIGFLLKSLITQNKLRISKLLNLPSSTKFEEIPLFPKWSFIESKVNLTNDKNIEEQISKPEAHNISAELRSRLNNIISNLEIPSERTGQKLRVFPTRLRRTLATRAAREGYGELIIAELLDHTDTQNARVYTENVPEHVNAINEAMARQLAPLAQAFSGMLVDGEKDATRGDDISSRIKSQNGNVGTCGHHGFCGALAPIACYTCRQFQPWLDGPHQEILNTLISERTRILDVTQDPLMASINDRTILAITQVISQCEMRRRQIKENEI